MLETVKSDLFKIQEDSISFEQYYQMYIMKMQDEHIAQEFTYMLNNNIVSVDLLDRAISDAYKELVL